MPSYIPDRLRYLVTNRYAYIALVAVMAFIPSVGRADTLFDAIQLAYATNPDFKAQEEGLRAIKEHYNQARSQFGPQVSLSAGYGYQASDVSLPPTLFNTAGNQRFAAATGNLDVSVVQPIYTFGRLSAGLAEASDDAATGRQELRAAEAKLLLNVITAYADVVRDREKVRVIQNEIERLTSISNEIGERGRVGDISKTDVAQSDGRLLSAHAQLIQAQAQLGISSATYLAVVGQNPGRLDPVPELAGVPGTAGAALDAAEDNNADLLAAIHGEQSARDRVDEAKSAFGPNLSVRLDASVQPYAAYIPNQYQRDLSAQVVFTQPLFTSGLNSSKEREAGDRDLEAELGIEQARRAVVQLVSQSWDRLTASQRVQAVVSKQLDAEAVAAEGNRLEERAGLRSVIDLLNSEAEFANAKLSALDAGHDEFVASATLLSAMGVLEVDHLSLASSGAVPVQRARDARPTTPIGDAIGVLLDRIGAPSTPTPRPLDPAAGGTRPNPADHPEGPAPPLAVNYPLVGIRSAAGPVAAASGLVTANNDAIGDLLGQ